MKLAGKKAGLMPKSSAEVESPAEDKGENEATESKMPLKKGAIKKTGTTDGKPNRLGGGGRFQQLVNKGKSPALAAFIGRKLYSKSKFQAMAAKGRKTAS